jgi:hypothetical protein
MAPMLSTFGGGSARGFNPGTSNPYAEAFANREILQPTFSGSQTFYSSSLPFQTAGTAVPTGWTTNGKEIKFSPDGSKLYYNCYSGVTPAQFSLSTPWDITTTSKDGDIVMNFNVSPMTGDTLIFDVAMDGYHILYGDRENLAVWKSSTQWDFDGSGTMTKVWDNYSTYASDGLQCGGFTGDLTGIWIYGRSDDKLQRYTTATELDYANLGTTPAYAGTGYTLGDNNYGMQMSGDGDALLYNRYDGGGNNIVTQLSTSYDLRTFQDSTNATFTTSSSVSAGNMGATLIRTGGLNSTAGRYYFVDSYGTGEIRQSTFTWR